MGPVVLDTGALVAAERNDRRFWAWWKWLTSKAIVAVVPAPVLAQAWRGPKSVQVARVALGCRVVPMDERGARRAGELCTAAGTADVVDAFVVCCAASSGADIVTSDPKDMEILAAHRAGLGLIRSLDELGAKRRADH